MTAAEAQREAVRLLRRVAVGLRLRAALLEAQASMIEERAFELERDAAKGTR